MTKLLLILMMVGVGSGCGEEIEEVKETKVEIEEIKEIKVWTQKYDNQMIKVE